MPRGQNIAANLSLPVLCRLWMPKGKPFGPPGWSAGPSSPAQSLRTLCCPTHKAAASACNRCYVKVQSFLSFTEAAGAPIAICTCGAFNVPAVGVLLIGRGVGENTVQPLAEAPQ